MKVLHSKRWCVVHDHDGSPMDGCLYIHKAKAIKRQQGVPNPEKFRVEMVAVMSVEMADSLMKTHG